MATNRVLDFFRNLFKPKQSEPQAQKEFHLEPKYWQEVMDLRERLEKVIKENTIEDDNVTHVNERVLDYLIEQINIKGSLPTIPERYAALNTLADRILLNYQSKLVGLKKNVTTHTDFTDAVTDFKKQLKEREKKELEASHDKGLRA
ncbi:MAG: hypothetical protein AB7I18_07465 [Candidatus Berkiella sp.]